MDLLQSNLDPWAHLQNQDQQNQDQETVTEPTTSTTKLSLFNIRDEAFSSSFNFSFSMYNKCE